MTGITVVEVFRALGIEPVKNVTWPVGKAVAKKWRDENGSEPPKANRTKTGGGGMHCIYRAKCRLWPRQTGVSTSVHRKVRYRIIFRRRQLILNTFFKFFC